VTYSHGFLPASGVDPDREQVRGVDDLLQVLAEPGDCGVDRVADRVFAVVNFHVVVGVDEHELFGSPAM
jgi:hypothetical protein